MESETVAEQAAPRCARGGCAAGVGAARFEQALYGVVASRRGAIAVRKASSNFSLLLRHPDRGRSP